MIRNNKKAFTLVELLAVIVILAVILVIAVPQVMNIIEDVRKASFSSSVKLLASEAEKKFVQNEVLGLEENISCEEISKLSKEDYEYCNITMDNGIALVTLVGKNKFEGMKVLNGTKTNADVTEDNGEELYTLEDVYRMVNSLTAQLEQEKSTNKEKIDTLTNRINELENTTANMSMLKAYPVGSIYMSENSTSPAELFGGTWVQLKDRFLLGAGDTHTAGSIGGEETHTLTEEELPNITGNINAGNGSAGATGGGYGAFRSAEGVFSVTNIKQYGRPADNLGTFAGNPSYSTVNLNFGNSQPHNNMPPYLTVYMWKRTA